VVYASCDRRYAEVEGSKVMKLRNELERLAFGEIDKVEGRTEPEELYVLLFGYQGRVESLSVPESLHKELLSLTPWDYERYVLVEVVGDKVKEYTKWEQGQQPQLTPMPIVIRGDPYRIIAERRQPHGVTIRVE
jgi:hypothetical protein